MTLTENWFAAIQKPGVEFWLEPKLARLRNM
jgi:hypothetical protein